MSLLKLQTYPENPILITPAAPVVQLNPERHVADVGLITLTRDMIAFAREHDGVGVAATQVGINQRIFVFKDEGYWRTAVNPTIGWYHREKIVREEGCLSLPGIYGNVPRAKSIKVSYDNEWGRKVNRFFFGVTARIFQHEYDHLNGILFPQRIHMAKHNEWINLKAYTRTELNRLEFVR